MSKRPDSLILVYDGRSGMLAVLLDVAKKAVGTEECPLCEITYGPLGHRRTWKECAVRLSISIEELHRDQIPTTWNINPLQLPCILARVGEDLPSVLVTREEIIACQKNMNQLETKILAALMLDLPE